MERLDNIKPELKIFLPQVRLNFAQFHKVPPSVLCVQYCRVPMPPSCPSSQSDLGPNQTDALLEVVTQQITLLTFDETDEDILMQLVNAL
jgi:hypothetical protein